MKNSGNSDDKYASEITYQEFAQVKTIISAILESNKKTLDEKTKGIIELIPEIMITSGKLKHNDKFKDMTFEDFLKSNDFKDLIIESTKNKFPADTIESQEIEFLKSIIPKRFYITNNKLSNEMTKDFLDQGEQELIVIRDKHKKGDIITYNSLTYDDGNITIMGKREFTAYDRAIHNAICSLYVAGNEIITSAMVYRTMNGMTETEYVSPQALKTVTNSIDKSRFLKLTVDFTEEAKARNMNVKEAKIEDYLLNAKKIWVKTNNNVIEAYKINTVPTLYQYAQLTKQILAIPPKLLDTKQATRNTEEIIPIKEYLIRRIEVMKNIRATKNNYTMSNKILYDTIFKEAGIIINHGTERDRYRKYIKEILNLWKERDGYIRNFSEYKEQNTIKGIEIVVNKKR